MAYIVHLVSTIVISQPVFLRIPGQRSRKVRYFAMVPLRSIRRANDSDPDLPMHWGSSFGLLQSMAFGSNSFFSSEVIIYHLQTAILRRLAQWIALMIDCIYLSAAAAAMMMNDTEILHKMHWLWLNSRHFSPTI